LVQNFEAAERISADLLDINEALNESIRQVHQKLTPEELKAYKRAVGYVMYEIFERILNPLYTTHPSLKPATWEEWSMQE